MIERIVGEWGDRLATSNAGISAPQLRQILSGLRSDHLLAAGLGRGPVREQFASEISEDVTWVAAAQDGDRAAFGQLYERYARMVHGVLLARVAVGEVDPGVAVARVLLEDDFPRRGATTE